MKVRKMRDEIEPKKKEIKREKVKAAIWNFTPGALAGKPPIKRPGFDHRPIFTFAIPLKIPFVAENGDGLKVMM